MPRVDVNELVLQASAQMTVAENNRIGAENKLYCAKQRIDAGDTTGCLVRDYLISQGRYSAEEEERYKRMEQELKKHVADIFLVLETRLIDQAFSTALMDSDGKATSSAVRTKPAVIERYLSVGINRSATFAIFRKDGHIVCGLRTDRWQRLYLTSEYMKLRSVSRFRDHLIIEANEFCPGLFALPDENRAKDVGRYVALFLGSKAIRTWLHEHHSAELRRGNKTVDEFMERLTARARIC